jgi:mycothiol synthase
LETLYPGAELLAGVRRQEFQENTMTLTQEMTTTKNAEFRLRPAQMDDLDAVVTLINNSGLDQEGRELVNAQDIAGDWNMPSFKLDSATRVAELSDGRIIGYVEIWDTDAVPVQNFVWARVDPGYEGQGIGTELMSWAESRLQKTVQRVPKDARVVFRSAFVSTHAPTKQLFEDLDLKFVRRFWHMMIELDSPPAEPVWPSGIKLSTYAETDDLLAIVRADGEAFQDHWGFVPQPEETQLEQFQERIDSQHDFDPNLWFLAMDGDEVAGICLCSRSRTEYPGAAWVNSLGVRRAWRRRGIGLALLHHAFGAFYKEGKERVGLGVDSSSLTGATRLYEKAGMVVVKQSDAYEKEVRSGRDLSTK